VAELMVLFLILKARKIREMTQKILEVLQPHEQLQGYHVM
jgi:hypothetical protein